MESAYQGDVEQKQRAEANAEEENWDQANMMKLPENIMSQQQD